MKPGDAAAIDDEITAGSSLLFYTRDTGSHVLLVNGRVNGPWFGSFWPDSPHIFLDDADLKKLWAGPQRVFLLTYHPAQRTKDLELYGNVIVLANSGGKTVLSNR
jgi:hypothetical protein